MGNAWRPVRVTARYGYGAADDGTLERPVRAEGVRVFDLEFSPDSQKLAANLQSAGGVWLWDLSRDRESRLQVSERCARFRGISFRPDGAMLAAAGADSTVRIFRVNTGQQDKRMDGNRGQFTNDVAYRPDGKVIAAATCNGDRLRLWDPETRSIKKELKGHSDMVWTVTFSPDGQLLASTAYDGTIRIWDGSGEPLHKMPVCIRRRYALAFHPGGKLLVSASWDNAVNVWDVTTGRRVRSRSGHEGQVRSLAIAPDGRSIFSASDDGKIFEWDLASRTVKRTFTGHRGAVIRVAVSRGGDLLASASDDKAVLCWNPATGEQLAELSGHRDCVYSLAIHPDGSLIASGDNRGRVILWDWRRGHSQELLVHDKKAVNAVAFSPDGRLLVTVGDDQVAIIWDTASRKRVHEFKSLFYPGVATAFSPAGDMLAIACYSNPYKPWHLSELQAGQLLIFDLDSGRVRHKLSGWVTNFAYSADGKKLLAGGHDGKIRVLDTATGRLLRSIQAGPPAGHINDVAFSPGGGHFLAANGNGTISIYRFADATAEPVKE